MKKCIAGLLILSMTLSIATPVFAEDPEQNQRGETVLTNNTENTVIPEDSNIGGDTDAAEDTEYAEDVDAAEDTEPGEDEYDTGDRADAPEEDGPDSSLEKDLPESEKIEASEEKAGDKDGIHYGWYYKKGNGWYYYNKSGVKQLGWQKVKNIWYYLEPEESGRMLSNCRKEIKGRIYSFAKDGAMKTGWEYTGGKWYYYESWGRAAGWRKIKNVWYYLSPKDKGAMLSNCRAEIGGRIYSFAKDGAMKRGWEYTGGKWYYYESWGRATGWRKIKNVWYYFEAKEKGAMASGEWKRISGLWYFLNKDGAMATNWLYRGGWYYLGGDGSMRTGWQQIGSVWYYFYKEKDSRKGTWGMMAKDTKIDGYMIGSNGEWSQAYDLANKKLNSIGRNLWAAYSWSAGIPYRWTSADASPGSEWFARYGFSNGYGDCYVMAATFCYMAKALGYEAHQMDGYVPTRSGGRTPHSWVEVVMNGSTYVFDPDFTHETGRNGYQISYGASGTWMYSGYHRIN